VLIEDLSVSIPREHRGGDRPERRGQVHAAEDDRRAGSAECGPIRIGETVELAFADQTRALDGEKTVWEEISGGVDTLILGKRGQFAQLRGLLQLHTGSDQQKQVKALSGGERNRVHLAKTLKAGANVIMLDEPTNDLDVNTLRALEDAFGELCGLRHRRQPRPLVPGSHRHAHSGL
jgi:ATPase subunit of ABC transporter with duplicated ATPase domains